MADSAGSTRRTERNWLLAFSSVVALVTVLHLIGLGNAPPGLYSDEASIGYNAWAVAHTGLDEHGAHLPLFFQAFGEYKSPVYIYSLAPLTWLGSLSPTLVRLPAALSGIGIAALAGVLALRLTGSRPAALLSVLSAGLEPWLWADSRVAFEPIEMVLLLLIAIVLLARRPTPRGLDFALAGVAIALSAYTYSSARLFGALLACAVLIVNASGGRRRRTPGWWLVLPPVALGYLGLLVYELLHPGVLLARYGAISIGSDGARGPVVFGRFITNYVQYAGPSFLFTHGDPNPRHSSGFGGMLSVAILPVLVLGIVTLVRRRRERFARLVLLGLLLSPVPAALTAEGTPHGLRATTMLPFLLVAIVLGWGELVRHLSGRSLLTGAATLVLLSGYAAYLWDYAAEYPGRSVLVWDTGEATAIADAHRMAAGHRVLISTTLDRAYIQALFVLRPQPGADTHQVLSSTGLELVPGSEIDVLSRPGDTLVLGPGDLPPSDARLVERVTYAVDRHTYDIARRRPSAVALASIWEEPGPR